MRTVLIGSDFMYDKDGILRPIEINTAVGWDGPEKVEDDVDCLDLTALYQFVTDNNFQSLHYVGDIGFFHKSLETHYSGSSVTYEFHAVGNASITVPHVEDNEQTLIIRSAYDTTALVDDTYCRDKVTFMNLIKDSSFGSQFAYIDTMINSVVSNITTINDNNGHPNFILKSRFPGYDKEVYPKFFKVSTQSELDTVIANNVTTEYFLMEYLFNPTKTWEGHSTVIRSLNILFPPTLESIQIGQYTKLNQNLLLDNVTYDSTTFEVNEQFRSSYNTTPSSVWKPKLLDTDMVEMSDGTFKTALDLQVGDIIKTIEIPNNNGVSIDSYISSDFGLNYETLTSSAIYANNTVTNKQKVNILTFLNELTFEDNSTWEDTMDSKYLIERSGIITFKSLFDLVAGDVVLLLDTTDNNINFVRKIVTSNTQHKRVFSGWFISVDNAMLFLTKTAASTNNQSYVSIEHNSVYCPNYACPCYTRCASCPKNIPYCSGGVCGSSVC
jgi:hypothetical protein